MLEQSGHPEMLVCISVEVGEDILEEFLDFREIQFLDFRFVDPVEFILTH